MQLKPLIMTFIGKRITLLFRSPTRRQLTNVFTS